MSKARPFAEILSDSARSLTEQIALARTILSVWKEILPPPLAQRSWPLKMEGETLIIGVESPLVAQELEFYLPQIFSGLNRVIPGFSARKARWEALEPEEPEPPQNPELKPMEPPPIPKEVVNSLPDDSPLKPIWQRILSQEK